jgi:hypothetical protein
MEGTVTLTTSGTRVDSCWLIVDLGTGCDDMPGPGRDGCDLNVQPDTVRGERHRTPAARFARMAIALLGAAVSQGTGLLERSALRAEVALLGVLALAIAAVERQTR